MITSYTYSMQASLLGGIFELKFRFVAEGPLLCWTLCDKKLKTTETVLMADHEDAKEIKQCFACNLNASQLLILYR